MADNNNGLVLNNNDNGTQSAAWTPFDEIPADKKVLMGVKDPLSGNMTASWEDVPVTPGVEFAAEPAAFTLLANIRNLSVDIPDGITSMNANAFLGCTGLTSVTFPASGMTKIGTYAFQNCTGLTSVDIPASVTSIGTGAFNGCSSLATATINSTALTIGNDAFRNCTSLTTVAIPEGTTTLGENVFRDDTALTTVTIPSTVTAIGQRTFNGCTNLATVTIAKADGSISGAPWGAPETTQIIWTGE